jgi:hypothetical protein
LEEEALGADGESEGYDEDDDDDVAPFKGHRGIPSWDDAIGFIIGSNMDARAKNPTPGRGRGGRDRGRSSGS